MSLRKEKEKLRKTSAVLILVVLALAMISVVGAEDTGASSLQLSFDTMMYREELEFQLDADSMIATDGLPEATPFWIDMIDAEWVRDYGEGVYVAVLDTGLLEMWPYFFYQADIAWEMGIGFTHDIWWDAGEFWMGPLRDDRGFITKAYEGSGHGTHVVSTIVGYNYNNLFWVRGVAPKATIIPVLVLDSWLVPYPGGTAWFRGGTDEMLAAGIYYVADLAETLDGPVIISMSLGGPDPSQMIEEAIDYAIMKDVIVVASAGNEGYDGMGYPGAYPQVISCALAGWTEQWVGYPNRWWLYDVDEQLNSPDYWGNNWQLFLDYISSRPNKALGQKAWHLDVATPGAAIVGPYKPYLSYSIGYYYLWGTSMSAPHVSGIAALILEKLPNLRQPSMEKILKIAAAGLPLPSDGSLVLDVPGALYYFTWFGIDWGSGFLQADNALWATIAAPK